MTPEKRQYMADYMRHRNRSRRAQAVAALGGRCVVCGTTELLQLDHIDPATKSFNLSREWATSEERLWAEVAKCQLLCKRHHEEKTARECGVPHGGGATGKRNCRCDLCRARKAEYNRNHQWRRKSRRRADIESLAAERASA